MPARLLFYGDDFTGAADNAAQFARHGHRTQLFFHLPEPTTLQKAVAECDVVGVAGTARSLDNEAMASELRPIWQAFANTGVPFIQYKCCSTFDSSPQIGSLGQAIRLMQEAWPGCLVPVAAAAPAFGRYTVFGDHFARAGDQVHRLDRHPVMAVHPITPMHEANLAKVLSEQGHDVDSRIDWLTLNAHRDDVQALVTRCLNENSVLFDGLDQSHMVTTAAALWQLSAQRTVCAVASQGLAHGMGQHWRAQDLAPQTALASGLAPVKQLLVLSGSCSALSATQIQHAMACGFVGVRISSNMLLDPASPEWTACQSLVVQALQKSQSVVVFTALGPHDPEVHALREATHGWPAGQLTQRLGEGFARLAHASLKAVPLKRLVVAGGDSSSYTMRLLGADALQPLVSHFGQNAHFATLVSQDPMLQGVEVLLKGGQVGQAHLYEMALQGFVGE